MRIFLFAFVAVLLLESCSGNHQGKHASDSSTSTRKKEIEGLQLNNGNKWKADSITNANVNHLKEIVQKLNADGDRSLSAYTGAGVELQTGLNKMIAECKMEGADHDALHKWLEPLIADISKLRKSDDITEATNLSHEVEKHLNLYGQYFE